LAKQATHYPFLSSQFKAEQEMNINAIAIGKNPPDDINVIIEVPIGGEPIKYEFDKDSNALFVDRFLYTPMRYPGNYGFVPHTLCGDGDPLDVMVMNSRPIIPGGVIRCRPIGVLLMEDDGGRDEKLIAVPVSKLTTAYDHVKDVSDLPEIEVKKVEHFFTHYKDLEPGKWAKIEGVKGIEAARQVVLDSITMANNAS
jgi:inorganic pyrophosphatase